MSTTTEFDYPGHVRSEVVDRAELTRGPEARSRRHAGAAKERVTIRLDSDVVESFKELTGDAQGKGYQSLMNQALREWLTARGLPEMLREEVRRVLREELAGSKVHSSVG